MYITVQARPGVNVPQEHHPRRHITSEAPVQVEDSPYYRRRMADGDLVMIIEEDKDHGIA